MSTSRNSVSLTKETIIQLQALSLPGEPLASVIQRAALALQTLESQSRADSPEERFRQRVATLESRVERIEARCGAYREPETGNQSDADSKTP